MPTPFTQAATGSLSARHSEEHTEFDTAITSEVLLESSTRRMLTSALGGDSANFTPQQASHFISEQMQPLLAVLTDDGSPHEEPQLQRKAQSQAQSDDLVSILRGDGSEDLQSEVDQSALASILASLNSQQRIETEMKDADSNEERDLMRYLESEVQQQGAKQQEPVQQRTPHAEVTPMLEAITTPMPQVSIELPGGGELRIVINAAGKPHVIYSAPDGSLRPLAKGKTLRLSRWVNGITITKEGVITFVP